MAQRSSKETRSVYIGPNLRELRHGTVFIGGLQPHVEELLKKSPSLGLLIVPLSRLSEARRRVLVKGDILFTAAGKVRGEISR